MSNEINKSFLNKFPKSSQYDLEWMAKHEMGPNAVWLTEFLSEKMDINKNMRILDLGCGKALSSVFLAKEFNAKVWAADLWISCTDNWKLVQSVNLENNVFPIHIEAHFLPFAEGFFDAIVSIDAYNYFGTDDYYLSYLLKYLKKDGKIGIIGPGLEDEFSGGIPPHLKEVWDPEFSSFHSSNWWRNHWEKSGLVDIQVSDSLPDGYAIWLEWESYLKKHHLINPNRGDDLDLLKADGGEQLRFHRIVAQKK